MGADGTRDALRAMRSYLSSLRPLVAGLDRSSMRSDDAMQLVTLFAEGQRLMAAGHAIAARRVEETRCWRSTGATSAADWVASRSGTTPAFAASEMRIVESLEQLPETHDAFVAGKLSTFEAREITQAAVADPNAEGELLELAGQGSFAALHERSMEVRAAAAGDEDARERIHRGRYHRKWVDREGAYRYAGKSTVDQGALIDAALQERTQEIVADARRGGGPMESDDAYAMDALVSLVTERCETKAVVNVHISQSALERGHAVAGESCRVDGVGPVSVAGAVRLATAGEIRVIETDGVDVTRVAHLGRTIPAHIRSALEARDATCVVPGCSRRLGLEIDHIVPFALGGRTVLENLARLCRWHHGQKTHHGWRLGGRPGAWTWTRKPHEQTARSRSP